MPFFTSIGLPSRRSIRSNAPALKTSLADWGVEPENEKGLLHTENNGKVIREYLPSMRGNYGEYYDGMYNAIRNYEPVPVAPEDGVKVVRIIEAAYESTQKKKVIEFH